MQAPCVANGVDTINGGVACSPVGGEYINGTVIGRLWMECVLYRASIGHTFVIHLLPCATKLCCFVAASITKASLQSFAVFIFFDIDFVIISFSGVVVAVVAVAV